MTARFAPPCRCEGRRWAPARRSWWTRRRRRLRRRYHPRGAARFAARTRRRPQIPCRGGTSGARCRFQNHPPPPCRSSIPPRLHHSDPSFTLRTQDPIVRQVGLGVPDRGMARGSDDRGSRGRPQRSSRFSTSRGARHGRRARRERAQRDVRRRSRVHRRRRGAGRSGERIHRPHARALPVRPRRRSIQRRRRCQRVSVERSRAHGGELELLRVLTRGVLRQVRRHRLVRLTRGVVRVEPTTGGRRPEAAARHPRDVVVPPMRSVSPHRSVLRRRGVLGRRGDGVGPLTGRQGERG